MNETSPMVAASKVNGTKVYNRAGEALGSIDDLMIDKQSGHITLCRSGTSGAWTKSMTQCHGAS
jgi:sporulation protein YlmC with PRC-barrel domain